MYLKGRYTMKISNTDKEITIIEFSKAELESCRITYENISRDEIRSKSAIFTIISEAAKISGKGEVISENTRIDILPDGEGGCIIVLNNTAEKTDEPSVKLFCSPEFDPIIDYFAAVEKSQIKKSSIYEMGKGYYLLLEGDEKAIRLCGEYLSLYAQGHIALSRIMENGKLLISDNASEILGGAASEK